MKKGRDTVLHIRPPCVLCTIRILYKKIKRKQRYHIVYVTTYLYYFRSNIIIYNDNLIHIIKYVYCYIVQLHIILHCFYFFVGIIKKPYFFLYLSLYFTNCDYYCARNEQNMLCVISMIYLNRTVEKRENVSHQKPDCSRECN